MACHMCACVQASGGDYDLLTGSDMGYVSAASTTLSTYMSQVH